jgi:hypothetical protein
MDTFETSLERLIGRFSVNSESDTPDFILAGYIRGCLDAWNQSVSARDKFYDVKLHPGEDYCKHLWDEFLRPDGSRRCLKCHEVQICEEVQ